jgi:hypothetical protein
LGKGGYLGGGTIIGPHTPEWFGRGSGHEEEELATAPEPAKPRPVRTGKMTRCMQRAAAKARKRAKLDKILKEATALKRDLTTKEAAEITTLRQVLKLSQQAHDKARIQLKADRDALNKRLAELGLPLED